LQNKKEQYAEIMIIKARIMNERDDVIHVLKRSTKGSKIRNQIDSTRLEIVWNVILQRPAYVACSETIKSATAHRSKGDWIDFVPYFACFRNCLTFFDYLRAG